ncbi:MAG: DUF188 domain-containing protein [Syntrophomonadaceae bacterium]|nr:DUF188 domain-containing protein [Syntrophomonadaceae bacterium]
MKILVDADACPRAALQFCMEIGRKNNIQVWTVASFNHNIHSDHHVVVGNDAQEADIKLSNMTEAGDVVITQDWGLAAIVSGKGARVIGPDGREFSSDRIEFLLEEREIKMKHRRGGGRTKGPRKRNTQDDLRFQAALLEIVRDSGEN